MKSVAVVGAGFAGLSAALELARSGYRVEVFEQHGSAGGRARPFSRDGYRFDTGPTLIVLVDALRRALGENAFAQLGLRRLEPGYRVLWPDGTQFDLHSNIALALQELSRFEPPRRQSAALQFLAEVHEQYTSARKEILEVDRSALAFARSLLSPGRFRPWAVGPLRSFVERTFSHPRVVQALTFQPLYLGTSPLRAPAVYSLLPVEEIVGGIWYACGGTGAVVQALVDECVRSGVTFHFGAGVSKVLERGPQAKGIVCNGETLNANGVVVTADREPALAQLFQRRDSPGRVRYGHSAIVWYLAIDRTVDLTHHSVLLPADPWRAYAELDRGELPSEPMLYVCNPCVSDDSMAPKGASSLLLLAPVPNLSALPHFDESAFFDRCLSVLERHAGALRAHIVFRDYRGPREFASELQLAHGAAFGPDHVLTQMGPFRPPIRHPYLRNVVFAGSGTRPGSGVPMVLTSGRLAAERLARVLA